MGRDVHSYRGRQLTKFGEIADKNIPIEIRRDQYQATEHAIPTAHFAECTHRVNDTLGTQAVTNKINVLRTEAVDQGDQQIPQRHDTPLDISGVT